MTRNETCANCSQPITLVGCEWEHVVPATGEGPGERGYTYVTCDPLLFDDRQHREARPQDRLLYGNGAP